jgi:hypothetical protein
MNILINRINEFCERLEKKNGLIVTSFMIGLMIIAFDMLYITPSFEAAYHGLQYSLLSNNPFDFATPNSLRYRILPSLIGYITFLRGTLFFIVPLLFTFLFTSTMYWLYRTKKYSPVDSFLFTGFIAFSCTVYIQLAAPGYTDVIFYFFIFLSFFFIRHSVLSACFFSLALLTHESSLFMLPGLLLYANYCNKESKTKLINYVTAYFLSILPLLLYRHWVSNYVAVEYDLSYYFSEKNLHFTINKVLPLFPAGLFYAFKLFWFFPLYALYKSWNKKEYNFMILILAIIVCDILQLIIAFDITRMLCLGFPAILLAAEKVKTYWSPSTFTRFALGLTLMNFCIIQYFMSANGIVPMLPSPYTYLIHLFIN